MNKEQFVVALICNKLNIKPVDKAGNDLYKINIEKTMFYSGDELSFDYVEELDLSSVKDFDKELDRIKASYRKEYSMLKDRKFKVRSYKYE